MKRGNNMGYTNADVFGGVKDYLLETNINGATDILKTHVKSLGNTNENNKEGVEDERTV